MAASATPALVPGALLAGRYRIISRLGSGAMGDVYRAEDQRLDQIVALKFLPARVASDPRHMSRVRDEVKVARRVSHPHVCRVHDLGESERGPFLSMEHIDGEDLASLLRRVGRLPEEKAIELGRQVCAGLAAAHAAGVLHRDLKPANVMLDLQGRAHITDFGIAIVRDDAGRPMDIAGTPAYMAPEQLAGKVPSEQSDLYSFGVLLYELVTGKCPFVADSLDDLRRQQLRGAPAPPSMLVSGVGPRLDAVIAKCLSVDPHERPSSAVAVLSELMGGDEMGAALSAGQTPSPRAVANAVVTGALKPAFAWACFAASLLCILFWFTFGKRLSLVERASLTSHPEVLTARVHEILDQLGNRAQGLIIDRGFEYDEQAIETMTRRSNPEPKAIPIRFWYRQGRQPSLGIDCRNLIGSDSPPLQPGELVVVLDPAGRLMRFSHNPGPGPESHGASAPDDVWPVFFRFAGLEIPQFRETKPKVFPPVYADTVSAWDVVRSGESPVSRVEAASVIGSPVYFEVFHSWRKVSLPPSAGLWSVGALSKAAYDLITLTAALLAWLNLRGGRADRRGAMRIASCVFVLYIVAWLCGAHHVPVMIRELSMLARGVAWGLLMASWIWLYYLALEPYVRRYSPASLVSWSRLVMGRATDPMVARDILLGMTATWLTFVPVTITLLGAQSGSVLAFERSLQPLLGTRFFVAGVADAVADAVYLGLMFLLLLLLGRSLIRYRLVAATVFVCMVVALLFAWGTTLSGLSAAAGLILILLCALLWLFVLVRLGLLGIVASTFLMTLGLCVPDAMSLSAWYSFITWSSIAVYVALAGFGLYFSVGPGKLIRLPSPDRPA
ncbi:MAG: serine/threonine-protein kinase [Acidobacteriota bacterium]